MILNNNTFYVHVPKTAGTSMEAVLDIKKGNYELTKHATLGQYRSLFLEKKRLKSLPCCFAIVRNPYDRFFSYFAKHIYRKRWKPSDGHPKPGWGGIFPRSPIDKKFPEKDHFEKWMIEVYDSSPKDSRMLKIQKYY